MRRAWKARESRRFDGNKGPTVLSSRDAANSQHSYMSIVLSKPVSNMPAYWRQEETGGAVEAVRAHLPLLNTESVLDSTKAALVTARSVC
jgi:hypothetical protein